MHCEQTLSANLSGDEEQEFQGGHFRKIHLRWHGYWSSLPLQIAKTRDLDCIRIKHNSTRYLLLPAN